MFGGGPGRMMRQEVSKPVDVRRTLSRLASYFKPYWPVLILVLVLILVNTYSQVVTPELTGQSVDCYLTPATESRLARPPRYQGWQPRPAPLKNRPTAGSTSCRLVLPQWITSPGWVN